MWRHVLPLLDIGCTIPCTNCCTAYLVIWSITLGHTHICCIKGHTPVSNYDVYWGDHCAVWKGKVWSFCLANEFGTAPRLNIAISAVAVHQIPARLFVGHCNIQWWQLVLQHDHTLPLCTKGCGLWDEEEGLQRDHTILAAGQLCVWRYLKHSK